MKHILDILSDSDGDSGSDDERVSDDDDDDDDTYAPIREPMQSFDDTADDGFTTSDDEPLSNIALSCRTKHFENRLYRLCRKHLDPAQANITGEDIVPQYDGQTLEYLRTFLPGEMLELLSVNTHLYSVQQPGKSFNICQKELNR